MSFVARRSLALLSAFAAMALASCATGPEPVGSKLAPHNHVYDLDKQGVKRLWSHELGQLTQNRALKDIYCAGQFVVVEAQNGEMHCLDAATGQWKATTILRDGLRIPPTAVGDRLAFVVNNSVVLYDTATDEKETPHPMDFPLTAQPLLHGNSLYLAGGDGKVARLALNERLPEWMESLRGPIWNQPVIAGGYLLASAQTGLLVWDLASDQEYTRWSPKQPARLTSGAAGIGGRFYVGDNRGMLYSIRADTGQRSWQRMMGAPIKGRLTPVGSDLLVVTAKPSLICLDGAGTREERWRVDGVVEVLAIGKARVYVLKEDGAVAALMMETGEAAWTDPVPPVCKVTGDDNSPTVYIADPRGSIVAIRELD